MRINLISPEFLSDQHLIAEYHELLMIAKMLEKYQNRNSFIPDRFCLGIGHVNFFKDKILYLKKRHVRLQSEMRRRGFRVNHGINHEVFRRKYLNDWSPDKRDYEIIGERIVEKIEKRPDWYRYKGKKFPKSFFVNLIKCSY